MEVAILFGSFALFLILRVPIGISLGLSSLVAIMTSGVVQPTYLAQGLVTGAVLRAGRRADGNRRYFPPSAQHR